MGWALSMCRVWRNCLPLGDIVPAQLHDAGVVFTIMKRHSI